MLKVDHLNVGHGDMSLVEFPDGKRMLVDCNVEKGSDALKTLKDRVPEVDDIRRIDVLAVTHPDADHITGIDVLLDEGFDIGAVWESGYRFDDDASRPEYERFLKLIDDLGGSTKLKAGRTPYPYGGAEVYCFCACGTSANEEVHYNGLVLKVAYAGAGVLFTGDCDLAAARDKVVKFYGPSDDGAKANLLNADYLHASHHGSRSFFKDKKEDDAYLGAIELIDPDVTVISCLSREDSEDAGSENQDWPPHDDAIKIYQDHSNEVLITGEDGTISFTVADDGTVERGFSAKAVEVRKGFKQTKKAAAVTVAPALRKNVSSGPKPYGGRM